MTLDLHKSGRDSSECSYIPYAWFPLMLTLYIITAQLSKLWTWYRYNIINEIKDNSYFISFSSAFFCPRTQPTTPCYIYPLGLLSLCNL